jgi:hypothetical protein
MVVVMAVVMIVVMVVMVVVVVVIMVMAVIMMVMIVMVMVMMVVVMAAFFLSQDLHMHMGSGDPHLFHLFPGYLRVRNADAGQFLQKVFLLLLFQKFQQGRRQHVAGSSHSQIKIDRLQMITSFSKKYGRVYP